MSSLSVNIDIDRVQSSVQAAIRPAVEAALAETDITNIIRSALVKPAPSDRSRYEMLRLMGVSDGAQSLLERLVREGLRDMAQQYVTLHLREQRSEVEEAFRRMMMGSADRLVRSFAGAVDNALKEDWGFELDVKVSHTTAEKEDDDV